MAGLAYQGSFHRRWRQPGADRAEPFGRICRHARRRALTRSASSALRSPRRHCGPQQPRGEIRSWGILGGIAFLLLGVPGALLWAGLMTILAVLPMA